MLNFFLVLGQVPGTNIELTFYDVMTIYLLAILAYWLRREYKLSKIAIKSLFLNFWLYVSKPRRGRPPKKLELWPEHIDIVPLVNTGFGNLWRLLRLAYRQAGPAGLDA